MKLARLWIVSQLAMRGALVALLLLISVSIVRADFGSLSLSWSLHNGPEVAEHGETRQ